MATEADIQNEQGGRRVFEFAPGDLPIMLLAAEYGFVNSDFVAQRTGRSVRVIRKRFQALRSPDLRFFKRVRPGDDEDGAFRRDPYEHYLTEKGARFLEEEYGQEAYGRDKVLAGNVNHDLKIREFHIALGEVKEWAQFQGQLMDSFIAHGTREYVNPDAHFVIGAQHYFLELENSDTTKTKAGKKYNERIDKCRRYLLYHESGAFQKKYKAEDFRVIILMTTEPKVLNFLYQLREHFNSRKFYISTIANGLRYPYEPIFATPKDFEGARYSIKE